MSAYWTGADDGDQRAVVEGGKAPPDVVPGHLHVVGLRQVHGGAVVMVGDRAGEPFAGTGQPVTKAGQPFAKAAPEGPAHRPLPEGDAALAADRSTCPVVLTADCVSIAIGSPEGIRVAVHAGWRGLVAGVVQRASLAAMDAGASRLVAGIGPCIGPCCYEFSPDDLAGVELALGPEVRATTTWGSDALDLRTAARKILQHAGVVIDFEEASCTACGGGWYSARARKDVARQALYVWLDEDSGPDHV